MSFLFEVTDACIDHLRAAFAAAPARYGSFHLFHHTAATLMVDAGADVCYVAEMLGHRKLETTMTYTRVSMALLREVHTATHPAEQAARTQAVRQ